MVHMTCVNKSPTIPECDDSDLEARVEALEECCEEVHTELDNKADADEINTELESIRAELNTLIAGWHYVGEVEDEESLPTTLTEGEVYYSLEDNGFYVAVSDDPNNGWRFISGVKSAIAPIHLEDGVISHDDSGVTAGTYGDTTNQTPDFGETFKAVSATVDSKGHVTSISEHTVELPDPYDLYDTKCGDIVTIDDAEAARVKSLTVSLSPVQAGTPAHGNEASDAYLMKASPTTDFNSEYLTVVGGTVAWNQLAPEADFSTHNHWWKGNGCDSVTFSNGIATVVTLQDPAPATIYNRLIDCDGIRYVKDHAYLACYEYKLNAQIPSGIVPRATILTYMPMFTTQGKDVTSNNWETFARVFKATESSGTSSVLTRFRIDMGASYTDSYEYQLRRPQVFDLTQMFGSTIADYIYGLEQATAGAGVAFFRKLFPKPYYAYNAGQLISVKTSAHQMIGFNAWDEEWETGGIDATSGANFSSDDKIRAKNYIPVIPNTNYCITCSSNVAMRYYDADKNFIDVYDKNHVGDVVVGSNTVRTTPDNCGYIRFMTWGEYGPTYKNDICINLSWDGERDGEYEAYKKWTYPLDSDLELRGIPKLDASNNLYYDGDTYESDGTVTRKYGIVDLGTLTWNKNTTASTNKVYFGTASEIVDAKKSSGNSYPQPILCSKYLTESWSHALDYDGYDKTIALGYKDHSSIVIYDTACANMTTTEFKTAMSGVYLVYELATPTTEEADAYTSPQTAYPYGTESFTDTRAVPIPVGTKHRYASIYPITGHDEVTVSVRGKNQLDVTASNQTINGVTFTVAEDNSITVNGTATADTYYYVTSNVENYLIAGKQYILNGCPSSGGSSRYGLEILYGRDPIVWARDIGSGYTFTATDSTNLRAEIFVTNGTQMDNVVFKPMVRFATETDATYEPYAENSDNYDTNLGRTVYGGTANVLAGSGKAEWKSVTYNGSEDWRADTATSGWYRYYVTNNEVARQGNYQGAILADRCATAKNYANFTDLGDEQMAVTAYSGSVSGNWIYIISKTISTPADLKSWLAQYPTQVVYELATPTDLTFTPQTVSLNSGTNNVWSDGYTCVEYMKDKGELTDTLAELQDCCQGGALIVHSTAYLHPSEWKHFSPGDYSELDATYDEIKSAWLSGKQVILAPSSDEFSKDSPYVILNLYFGLKDIQEQDDGEVQRTVSFDRTLNTRLDGAEGIYYYTYDDVGTLRYYYQTVE